MVKNFTRRKGSERNCADCSRGFDREVEGVERKTAGVRNVEEK
jgi:hypothetical protein